MLSVWSSLYILDINLLLYISFSNIFFHLVYGFFFCFIDSFFDCVKAILFDIVYWFFLLFILPEERYKIKVFPRPISKSIQSVFSSGNLWFQVLHLRLLWEYFILILLMFANLINEKACLIFFLTFSCLHLNKLYFFLRKLPVHMYFKFFSIRLFSFS